ncbi:MAG: peptidase M13 [Caldithrix sp.]|nr:peptidase M13 [Caldithrix sp.]
MHFKWISSLLVLLVGLAYAGDQTKLLQSGIDQEYFDITVRAQDDFFRYVNGTWLKETKIPQDKSNYGAFIALADQAKKDLRRIIEEAAASGTTAGSEAQKIGDFYLSFMDTSLIRQRGLQPLQPLLSQINSIKNRSHVIQLMVELRKIGVQRPFTYWISQDSKNSDAYITYITQSGLGLPDRDYYFKEDEKFATIRERYKEYITTILNLGHVASAEQKALRIFDMERNFAHHHWTRVENRDPHKTYNKFTIHQLDSLAPYFMWNDFIEYADIPQAKEVVVRQPDYLQALDSIFSARSLDDWKAYFTYKTLHGAAILLSKSFVQARFDFYGKTLSGTEQMEPRWKRAVNAVNGNLGKVVGKVYVKKHFKPQAKESMVELVENLLAAYEQRIKNLQWMSAETRSKALTKLSKFNYKIGYPDKWKDYSQLVVKKDELIENYERASRFYYKRNVQKLGQPIDLDEWFMNPQTVNAYYNPRLNEIVFPAAILQPPFFNLAADDAVNYGAIGAVIGHEITHGFDDQGRKYDGNGNLNNWWTEGDIERFTQRAEGLVEQYSQYSPVDTMHLDGEFTLGENIADLGGLTIAYHAYKRSLNGQQPAVIEGFTGDQRFFIGWAQVWRRKYRPDEMRKRVLTDPHSPSEYRVIGVVTNMPAFHKAFNLNEGDKLYKDEQELVKIW